MGYRYGPKASKQFRKNPTNKVMATTPKPDPLPEPQGERQHWEREHLRQLNERMVANRYLESVFTIQLGSETPQVPPTISSVFEREEQQKPAWERCYDQDDEQRQHAEDSNQRQSHRGRQQSSRHGDSLAILDHPIPGDSCKRKERIQPKSESQQQQNVTMRNAWGVSPSESVNSIRESEIIQASTTTTSDVCQNNQASHNDANDEEDQMTTAPLQTSNQLLPVLTNERKKALLAPPKKMWNIIRGLLRRPQPHKSNLDNDVITATASTASMTLNSPPRTIIPVVTDTKSLRSPIVSSRIEEGIGQRSPAVSKSVTPILRQSKFRRHSLLVTSQDGSVDSPQAESSSPLPSASPSMSPQHKGSPKASPASVVALSNWDNQQHEQAKHKAQLRSSQEIRRLRARFEFLKPWLCGKHCASILLHPNEYDQRLFNRVLKRLHSSMSLIRIEVVYQNSESGQHTASEERFNGVSSHQPIRDQRPFILALQHSLTFLGTLILKNVTIEDLHRYFAPITHDHGAISASSHVFPRLEVLFIQLASGRIEDHRQLLIGLASLPNLYELHLQVQSSFDIHKIVSTCNNVTALRLICKEEFLFEDEHILDLARSLTKNQHLLHLSIQPSMSAVAIQALSKALTLNVYMLSFEFSYKGNRTNSKENCQIVSRIVDLIKWNPTITTITNTKAASVKVSRQVEVKLRRAVQSNPRMRFCHAIDGKPMCTIPRQIEAVTLRNSDDLPDLIHCENELSSSYSSQAAPTTAAAAPTNRHHKQNYAASSFLGLASHCDDRDGANNGSSSISDRHHHHHSNSMCTDEPSGLRRIMDACDSFDSTTSPIGRASDYYAPNSCDRDEIYNYITAVRGIDP